jgi:hypothetical protein
VNDASHDGFALAMPFRGYRAGIGTVEAEVTQCAVVQVLEGACRPAGQGA